MVDAVTNNRHAAANNERNEEETNTSYKRMCRKICGYVKIVIGITILLGLVLMNGALWSLVFFVILLVVIFGRCCCSYLIPQSEPPPSTRTWGGQSDLERGGGGGGFHYVSQRLRQEEHRFILECLFVGKKYSDNETENPTKAEETLDDFQGQKENSLEEHAETPEEKEREITCPICIGDYEPADIVSTLDCGHIFHTNCLLEWLESHNACPCCRVDMVSFSRYEDVAKETLGEDRWKEVAMSSGLSNGMVHIMGGASMSLTTSMNSFALRDPIPILNESDDAVSSTAPTRPASAEVQQTAAESVTEGSETVSEIENQTAEIADIEESATLEVAENDTESYSPPAAEPRPSSVEENEPSEA